MTAVPALVSSLRTAGVRFALVDGRVRVEAPVGVLTDHYRAALRDHRDEVLALLRVEAESALVGATAAAAITRALRPEGRGGIVITSRALDGQQILFVGDETVPVPAAYAALVRFTHAELEQIGQERWSAERLRAVVRAKEALAGTVVSSVSFVDDQRLQALLARGRAAGVRVELDAHGELSVSSPHEAAPLAYEILRYAGAVRELLGGEETPAVPAREWLARQGGPA